MTDALDRFADRDTWSTEDCSVAHALEVVGTRSAMLLMREAFYGTRRFDDFARRTGLTDAVAAARLKDLVTHGLLERRPYQEQGQRTRMEYRLTAKGRDLLPAVVALKQWADAWLSDPVGGAVRLEHTGCGSEVTGALRCTAGHDVPAQQITATPGPAWPSGER